MPGRNKGVRKIYHCAHTHSPVSLSPEFIQKTIRVWQPYSDTPLTEEDAREITTNMVSFIRFLEELDRKYGNEKHDNTEDKRDNERDKITLGGEL